MENCLIDFILFFAFFALLLLYFGCYFASIQFLLVSLPPIKVAYPPCHPRDQGRPAHQDGPLALLLRFGENLPMFLRCLWQKVEFGLAKLMLLELTDTKTSYPTSYILLCLLFSKPVKFYFRRLVSWVFEFFEVKFIVVLNSKID